MVLIAENVQRFERKTTGYTRIRVVEPPFGRPTEAKMRVVRLVMSSGEMATDLNAGFGGASGASGIEGAFRAGASAVAQKRLFVRAGSKLGAANCHGLMNGSYVSDFAQHRQQISAIIDFKSK